MSTTEDIDKRIALCVHRSELTREEQRLLLIEKQRCKKSFLSFLRYVRIIEPPTHDNIGGVIKFELWEHLREAIKLLLSEKLIIWLKARQVGASWLISAYDLWRAMSQVGTRVMIFSKGETEAYEKLAKCKEIYNSLPEFLRLKIQPDSIGEIGFPVMKSSIKAFPATQTAGISFTASVLDIDEWAEHPFAGENYLRAKPTIDTAGGQLIGVFTPNPWDPDCLAHTLFRDAMAGRNNFSYLFTPYTARPGRDKAWYNRIEKDTPEQELKGLSRELYMLKCFPSSIEEALSSPETVVVFDKKVLNAMADDVRSPININWEGIDNEVCHIYKDYHIGNFYIAGTDVSLGVGRDFNVTVIMQLPSGEIVADIMSQYLAPEELALHSVQLLNRYHNPLWWIEQNLWGRTVIKKALKLNYTRLGCRAEKKPVAPYNDIGKFGFVTDEKARGDLFGALIPAINDYQIKIYNQSGLDQFRGIIRNAAKKGKVEAISSKHDDYVIATGICWLRKDDVKTGEWKPKPIEGLHFPKHKREWPRSKS